VATEDKKRKREELEKKVREDSKERLVKERGKKGMEELVESKTEEMLDML